MRRKRFSTNVVPSVVCLLLLFAVYFWTKQATNLTLYSIDWYHALRSAVGLRYDHLNAEFEAISETGVSTPLIKQDVKEKDKESIQPTYTKVGGDYLIHQRTKQFEPLECDAFRWKRRSHRAKIYYGVILGPELRILDIVLHEIYDWVDKIILVEMERTHQNAPKPLYFHENKHLFKRFLQKIVHIVVPQPEINRLINLSGSGTSPAIAEVVSKRGDTLISHQMEWMHRAHIAAGVLKQPTRSSDVVIVVDVDELIRGETLEVLQKCLPPPSINFCLKQMYFGFSCEHASNWFGNGIFSAELFRKRAINWRKTYHMQDPKHVRRSAARHKFCQEETGTVSNLGIVRVRKSFSLGWHMSTFGGLGEEGISFWQQKVATFSHSGMNSGNNTKRELVADRIRHCHHPLGPQKSVGRSLDANSESVQRDLPWYVVENKDYFHDLLFQQNST